MSDDRPATDEGVAAAKKELRRRLLAARAELSPMRVSSAGLRLAGHLMASPEVRAASTVAAYVSIGAEPSTGQLLDGLRRAFKKVIVPVVQPDLDLDWAPYDGPGSLATARMGLREPTGPRLGVDAVGDAQVVLLPGLAVGADGVRLGRGGGCYDRALGRVSDAFTCVLLYDDELLDAVPREAHDRPVQAAVTPGGFTHF